MAVLVVAEHDNQSVRKATLNAVAAAQKLRSDIHVLIAGHEAAAAAKAAAQIAGVAKVLHADGPQLRDFLAENVAAVVVSVAKNYSHLLAPSTSNGKNVMPRVAALLDVEGARVCGQFLAPMSIRLNSSRARNSSDWFLMNMR